MDGRDFYTRLKKIKAEVLAMKQAHDYGLGRVDLDTKSVQFDLPAGGSYDDKKLYVRLEFYNTATQPMIQYWNYYFYYYYVDFTIDSYSNGVMILSSESLIVDETSYYIIFSATTPIKNISWSIE